MSALNGHFLLSSHFRSTLTPTPSTTTTPSGGSSPVFGSAPLSGTPEPHPLTTTLSASASSASVSASSSHSSSCSDPDRSDQGYASDCSLTEVSTPSLTTTSLASSSPPDSPGLEHDFFYEHGERGGTRRACELPAGVLNLFRCNADRGSFVTQLAEGPMMVTILNGLYSTWMWMRMWTHGFVFR